MDALNTTASQCTCAGIDSNIPLLDYMEDSQSLNISCNYNDLDDSMWGVEIPFCESIENTCNFAGILNSYYDQDSNNNGVSDSKSLDGLLGLSGATVTGVEDLIYFDDFE